MYEEIKTELEIDFVPLDSLLAGMFSETRGVNKDMKEGRGCYAPVPPL